MTYFLLVVLGLLLNIRNKGNLQMLGLVILSYYFPTGEITSYWIWTYTVLFLDTLVLMATMRSQSLVAKPLFVVTFMMVLAHCLDIVAKTPETYKSIIVNLEHLQIICFSLCAPNPIFYLKRKAKQCLKKCGYGY